MNFYPFLKAIASIMAGIMLLFCPIKSTDSYGVTDEQSCKLNFAVLSDAHIEGNNMETYERFAQVLSGVKKSSTGYDAAVYLGDNTMNGQNIESMFFYGQINRFKPAENEIVCLGNHDVGNGEGDYNQLLSRFIGYNNTYFNAGLSSKPYYYKVINGYYFVVLGSEALSVNSMTISDEQLSWLNNVLAEATAGNKPVFVFNHHPVSSIENQSRFALRDILNNYNNVFYFYGHTHWTLNEYSFDEYGNVVLINLPRCVDGNLANDTEGIGLQIEVYDDSIIVRPRDYYAGNWLSELEHTYTLNRG